MILNMLSQIQGKIAKDAPSIKSFLAVFDVTKKQEGVDDFSSSRKGE